MKSNKLAVTAFDPHVKTNYIDGTNTGRDEAFDGGIRTCHLNKPR